MLLLESTLKTRRVTKRDALVLGLVSTRDFTVSKYVAHTYFESEKPLFENGPYAESFFFLAFSKMGSPI